MAKKTIAVICLVWTFVASNLIISQFSKEVLLTHSQQFTLLVILFVIVLLLIFSIYFFMSGYKIVQDLFLVTLLLTLITHFTFNGSYLNIVNNFIISAFVTQLYFGDELEKKIQVLIYFWTYVALSLILFFTFLGYFHIINGFIFMLIMIIPKFFQIKIINLNTVFLQTLIFSGAYIALLVSEYILVGGKL